MTDSPLSPLIQSADAGNAESQRELFRVLYAELRAVARRELARIGGGATLGPTAVLHEAYLQLSQRQGLEFPDQARFMAYAAQAMRGLVIDYARRRQAQKRGGGFEITALPTDIPAAETTAVDADQLERLSAAIDALAAHDSGLAELVNLKYFSGFSFIEIAALSHVSERTVLRHWEKARIFLHLTLRNGDLQ